MKHMLPKVTIAIPTYNQQRFILDAVKSALAQSYRNLEVVVIDDASSDETAVMCKAFADDDRFKYVRNNVNLGRVRNYRHGIQDVATGDWFLNLDGDDYLTDRDYVSEAMRVALSDPGIVLVWGNCLVAWDGKDVAPYMSKRFRDPIIMSGEKMIFNYPPFLSTISPPHLAAIVRRDVALASDYYRDNGLCCDSESVYRVGFGHKVAVIDRVAGVWRQHGGNDSHTMVDQIHSSNVSRSNGIYQWAQHKGMSKRHLRRLRRTLDAGDGVALFARTALSGRLRHAPLALMSAMRAYPRSAPRIALWVAQRCARVVIRRAAMVLAPSVHKNILSRLIGSVPCPPQKVSP